MLSKLGINHRKICPRTYQQNGAIECKHRHMLEKDLSLLLQATLPMKFWIHASRSIVYIINKLPSKVLLNKSPYELCNKMRYYSFLKVFDSLCFPCLREYNKNKSQSCSTSRVFLGYVSQQQGYLCIDIQCNRLHISRHVIVHENAFPF